MKNIKEIKWDIVLTESGMQRRKAEIIARNLPDILNKHLERIEEEKKVIPKKKTIHEVVNEYKEE